MARFTAVRDSIHVGVHNVLDNRIVTVFKSTSACGVANIEKKSTPPPPLTFVPNHRVSPPVVSATTSEGSSTSPKKVTDGITGSPSIWKSSSNEEKGVVEVHNPLF